MTSLLRNERWREYLNISSYEEGNRLILGYWRDSPDQENKIIIEVSDPTGSTTGSNTITGSDRKKEWSELTVRHEPKLPSCSIKEVCAASKINHLNIEKV